MDIQTRIKEIIINTLEMDLEVSDFSEENIIELYGINSVDALEILLYIEEEYDIQVDDDDLNVTLLNSINNLSTYVGNKLKDK